MTATDAPARTGVAHSAAPAPVEKPHASRHAWSTGSSAGTATAQASWTITRSANVPQRSTWLSTAPSDARCMRRRCAQVVRAAPAVAAQAGGAASPHGARQAITTRSPGATIVTSGPTSSTTPAPSWPSRIGNGIPQPPVSTTCRSEWQTPHASSADLHLVRTGRIERDLVESRRRARLGVDEPARHAAARRSCSSSGTSGAGTCRPRPSS